MTQNKEGDIKAMRMYFVFDKDNTYFGSSHSDVVADSISRRKEGSKVVEGLWSPVSNERVDYTAEKTPTTPQIHPKTGWMKIIDRDAGWNTVYYSKQACELSCENDHHCKGIQEVEIRPAQSEGNREKDDGLRGWTIYAEQYHVALRALAKLAMLGGGRSEGNCVAQEALDEIYKIYKRMEPIQNAMNSQGGKS